MPHDPLFGVPHHLICNARTGFTPIADEQHYVSLGLSPDAIVTHLYGKAAEGTHEAEWRTQRIASLKAWRAVWVADLTDYGASSDTGAV